MKKISLNIPKETVAGNYKQTVRHTLHYRCSKAVAALAHMLFQSIHPIIA